MLHQLENHQSFSELQLKALAKASGVGIESLWINPVTGAVSWRDADLVERDHDILATMLNKTTTTTSS